MSSAKIDVRHWWHSSSLRLALITGLSMWLLNSIVVLSLYDFTLRALVTTIGGSIDTKIDKRLADWPKQLPQHAGVTSWLYRKLAVEIAELEDCAALTDADGEVQLANIDTTQAPEFRYRQYFTATFTGDRWRTANSDNGVGTCLVTARILTDGGHFVYGVPFDNYMATIHTLNKLRFWGLLITAMASLLVTLMATRRTLRRLSAIYQVCDRVATGDLKQRIQLRGGNDDIDRISSAINNMLDQIEHLMEGVREVSDAIAHDLKTPLARLRGQLELLLSISERSDDAIDAVIAEADQVLNAFNALLRIAQLEQGTRRQAFVHFDFIAVLQQVRDIFELVFADKNIRFAI
ncbi:MAG TPA: HAMP domain-containing sensor histidine kinase, partial [Spongiibacteraceae bacterium]